VLSGLNIALILSLLYVYIRNLRKMPTLFTWGLVIFAFLFLVQNVVTFAFAFTMMPLYVMEVKAYVLIFTALQTLAFALLNIITWR